jgi:hypothetical protein
MYSSAAASRPFGVGLCGLLGYDMVESHVTVMMSLSMSGLLLEMQHRRFEDDLPAKASYL